MEATGRSHIRLRREACSWVREAEVNITETAPVQGFPNWSSPILLEGHVLPPQPAALVPPPLRALLQVPENQLSALPLKPEDFSGPQKKGSRTRPGSLGPGRELAHLPEPREIPG